MGSMPNLTTLITGGKDDVGMETGARCRVSAVCYRGSLSLGNPVWGMQGNDVACWHPLCNARTWIEIIHVVLNNMIETKTCYTSFGLKHRRISCPSICPLAHLLVVAAVV